MPAEKYLDSERIVAPIGNPFGVLWNLRHGNPSQTHVHLWHEPNYKKRTYEIDEINVAVTDREECYTTDGCPLKIRTMVGLGSSFDTATVIS